MTLLKNNQDNANDFLFIIIFFVLSFGFSNWILNLKKWYKIIHENYVKIHHYIK